MHNMQFNIQALQGTEHYTCLFMALDHTTSECSGFCNRVKLRAIQLNFYDWLRVLNNESGSLSLCLINDQKEADFSSDRSCDFIEVRLLQKR